jgi:hypothetical protein
MPNANLPSAGLCAQCRHARIVRSDRGSVFYLCQRALTDASFPKYPRLPVMVCLGFETNPEPDSPWQKPKNTSC